MKKNNLKRFIIFFLFIGLVFLFRYLKIGNYISLQGVKQNLDLLQQFVTQNYLLSIFGYIGFYIVVMAFAIPVAAVMTLTGGFLFGTFAGAFFANIGATLGCVVSFLMVRYALGQPMKQKYETRLVSFNKELKEHGHLYLFSSRLIIVFPPVLINILAGLANVSLITFFWTTLLGMLPGAFVYAFAGQQLHSINAVGDVLSFNVIMAVTLLLALSLIPVLVRFVKSLKAR